MENMNIVVKDENYAKTFDIYGLIRPMTDAKHFIDALSICKSGDRAIINIHESYSLGSSLIGYLIKMANNNSVNITLNINNEDLLKTLEELRLQDIFKIQKL